MALEQIEVRGGTSLQGTVKVSGAKNAALPLMNAAALVDGPVRLTNVPRLTDIETMADLLRGLGALCEWVSENSIVIDGSGLRDVPAVYDKVRKMRASIYAVGPLLARLGKARVSLPGGCQIGPRPVDLHIRGLKDIGVKVEIDGGYMNADATEMRGGVINLLGPNGSSVGATCNVMMAAMAAPGATVIKGAAREPEVSDLANFFNTMGGSVDGAGTGTITIEGGRKLGGGTYQVISDRIEAGTYLVAGAITNGDVTLEQAPTAHMGPILQALRDIGYEIEELDGDRLRVHRRSETLSPISITTEPHPGFPTDMQAQLTALLCLVPGESRVEETIYVDRFIHCAELMRMGADLTLERGAVNIRGVESMGGAPVMASDLRASAALILAGLAANGVTNVLRVYHIDRGYERIDEKLRSLGARIRRVEERPTETPDAEDAG